MGAELEERRETSNKIEKEMVSARNLFAFERGSSTRYEESPTYEQRDVLLTPQPPM